MAELQLPLPNFDERSVFTFYRIVNTITGKSYIGMTVDYTARKKRHLYHLKRQEHHSKKLQNSYNKYGKDAFLFEIVERGLHTQESAIKRETELIIHFDSYTNGYNENEGGAKGKWAAKPVVWNKIRYKSVKEAARAIGIPPTTLSVRLKRGLSGDDDISHVRDSVECTYNGVTYSSFTEAAKANGISRYTLQFRLSKGYSNDADVPPELRNSTPCVWNGIEYPSISSLARALELPFVKVYRLIKRGYKSDDDMKK